MRPISQLDAAPDGQPLMMIMDKNKRSETDGVSIDFYRDEGKAHADVWPYCTCPVPEVTCGGVCRILGTVEGERLGAKAKVRELGVLGSESTDVEAEKETILEKYA